MSDEKEDRTCVVCGTVYQRVAWMTFDQGQCDDCIATWAREEATRHADAAISSFDREHSTTPAQPHKLAEALRIHKIWNKP